MIRDAWTTFVRSLAGVWAAFGVLSLTLAIVVVVWGTKKPPLQELLFFLFKLIGISFFMALFVAIGIGLFVLIVDLAVWGAGQVARRTPRATDSHSG